VFWAEFECRLSRYQLHTQHCRLQHAARLACFSRLHGIENRAAVKQ
jgi:hypothetical protein